MGVSGPEELFGDIAEYVAKAHAILEAGQWVDLAGLDKDVEALCLSIASLSPEQAKEYAPELEYLKEQVEKLEAVMRQKRSAVQGEMQEAKTMERANKAYTQVSALSKDTES